jgi:hypothetical protein
MELKLFAAILIFNTLRISRSHITRNAKPNIRKSAEIAHLNIIPEYNLSIKISYRGLDVKYSLPGLRSTIAYKL